MGMVSVKCKRAGVKAGDIVGFYNDTRVNQGDVIQISDAPKMKEIPGSDGEPTLVPVPGTIAAFSDNKRKKNAGWMEFVSPEDEKKFRSGGFNPAGHVAAVAAPTGGDKPAATSKPAGGKPEGKSTGDKEVLK